MASLKEKPLGEITLELYRGAVKPSNRVPCHFSTPSKPTNPRLAPDRAWCLIPKAHLAAGQTYIVVAKGLPQDSAHLAGGAWKFKVGTK